MWSMRRQSTSPPLERVKAPAERLARPESSMAEWASEKIPTNKTQRDCKIDNYSNTSNYPNASNDKLLISHDNTIVAPRSAGATQLATAKLLGGCSLMLNAKLPSSTPNGLRRPIRVIRVGL